jgi:phasin family protein
MPSFPTNPLMRSGLDAQVDFLTELTRRTYEAVRKLSELNLHFTQQVMQDLSNTSRNVLSCSDPFQMLAVAARSAQPAGEHLYHYQRQLVGMLSGAQLELTRTAQTFVPEAGRYASAMAQSMAHDAQQGGEAFRSAARDFAQAGAEFSSPAADSRSYGGNGAHYTPG